MRMAKVLCALALAGIILAAPAAAAEEEEDVALTVYNDGNAIVREARGVNLSPGTHELKFVDVAATIDPSTVKFRSLTDPGGTSVVEQNYEYDLVSADKLLQKYVDKPIEVVTEDGTTYTGRLLSFSREQLVMASREGPLNIVSRQDNVKNITCRELPEGLITRPTLVWLISSQTGGHQRIEVAYSASNCSWKADYTALLSDDDTELDLSGWVTLTNNSGKTYEQARLKLIAGEVHRVEEPRRRAVMMLAAREAGGAPSFEEKAFAEYHLYTLPRRTTIKDAQIKQIELLSADRVPCEKKYLFDPMRGIRLPSGGPLTNDFSLGERGDVRTFINFENDEASNLGMPLPSGRVRLFKMDEGDMEFVGEDEIDHTPKDEAVELLMGTAFDITAERKRTNFERGRGADWMEESFEITLRNHKEEPVTVHVREHLFRWVNWRILKSTHEWEKLDAQTIEFPVDAAPDEEVKVTYTVRYDW